MALNDMTFEIKNIPSELENKIWAIVQKAGHEIYKLGHDYYKYKNKEYDPAMEQKITFKNQNH